MLVHELVVGDYAKLRTRYRMGKKFMFFRECNLTERAKSFRQPPMLFRRQQERFEITFSSWNIRHGRPPPAGVLYIHRAGIQLPTKGNITHFSKSRREVAGSDPPATDDCTSRRTIVSNELAASS
jgi:hypothetical protein